MKSDWSRSSSHSPTVILSPTPSPSCNAVSIHPFNQHLVPFKSLQSSQSRNISPRGPAGSSFSINMSYSRKRAREESPEVSVDAGVGQQLNCSKSSPESLHGRNSPIARLRNGLSSPGQAKREIKVDGRIKSEPTYGIEISAHSVNCQQDPSLRLRRKYQRRNVSSGSDAKGACLKVLNSPMSGSSEPAVDQFTRLLGVGWARISDDKDVQAAARGWSRYIENHYPLSMVSIVLRSKGLEANLAETKNGYFLFKDDLSEGQLVGLDWESSLENLQRKPIAFQGLEPLKATRNSTPHPGSSSSSTLSTCRIDSNLGSFQIETSWLCREDDEMVVN